MSRIILHFTKYYSCKKYLNNITHTIQMANMINAAPSILGRMDVICNFMQFQHGCNLIHRQIHNGDLSPFQGMDLSEYKLFPQIFVKTVLRLAPHIFPSTWTIFPIPVVSKPSTQHDCATTMDGAVQFQKVTFWSPLNWIETNYKQELLQFLISNNPASFSSYHTSLINVFLVILHTPMSQWVCICGIIFPFPNNELMPFVH